MGKIRSETSSNCLLQNGRSQQTIISFIQPLQEAIGSPLNNSNNQKKRNDVVMDGKMSSEDGKNRGFVVAHHHESYPPQAEPPPSEFPPPPPPPQQYYGTFQGVPTYPPAFGFPQNAPPAAASDPQYYSHGYQSVPGYAVANGRPITVRERRLPCCGIGLGWFLFILGFFLAGIPWYLGAILLICTRRSLDFREKPGYVLCTIAAVLVTVAVVLGVTKGIDDWDWDWDWDW